MAPIARFSLAALDCPDTEALARFYAEITGWEVSPHDDDSWVELAREDGATLAFQKVPDHTAPTWPEGERPQQLHLDFDVPDLDEGERQVLEIGARKADHQPYPDSFRVFLDPAGHPFCLVKAG
ncbi:VOC family protein [Ornithinicoccus halotolerans]|uniref:VOC family protein n=1 Tax=Ornithinicoccus halotolerans TaxID=1748220 RepID=UPI00129788E9|nr:VOC family protein [Ornithinicoccus halotolerans]